MVSRVLPATLLLACLACAAGPAPVTATPMSDHFDGTRYFAPWAKPGEHRSRGFMKFLFGSNRPVFHEVAVAPTVPPRGAEPGGMLSTWIGHASVLVQMPGLNLLTDPQWSYRASPVTWAGPHRYMAPGVRLEDLPPIQLVLLSHNHYDHMDRATLVRLNEAFHPVFLAPLGNADRLSGWGLTNVHELDWWNELAVGASTITCVPAQHFSARTLWDRNTTLWAGWVVRAGGRSFYFAGDTVYGPFFHEIGARLGPFDLAAIPIGAYAPPEMMQPVHLNPEEAVCARADVRAARALAIHWGTFCLSLEPQDEPPTRLKAALAADHLAEDRFWVLHPGETRTVPAP